VAHYFPQSTVDLLDIDGAAVALAQENAAFLNVEDRVSIRQANLFDGLDDARYDLIVSNPPYVDAADLEAMPAEFHHEPELALGSGADGLDLTRTILASAAKFLRPDGLLIVEVGNSWAALEAAYPQVPFTWVDFEHGGHGVFTLTALELQDYSASLGR
jgi:ribosomal protein L3 glutamine methyltransferase